MISAIQARGGHQLLVAVAFDGVLTKYARRPDSVNLTSEQCDALLALGRRPDTSLALISGRRIDDLGARAHLGDAVYYVGLHGLEISGPDFVARDCEAIDAACHRVHDLAETVTGALSSTAGVLVENKEAAIAVHTRDADDDDAVWARIHLLSAAAELVRRDELRVVRGNHVMELLPNVAAPRARAIRWIRQHLQQRVTQPVFTVYIGEDVPDDDAVEAVTEDGISAVVGRRRRGALYHLRSPADVWQFIDLVTAARPHAA